MPTVNVDHQRLARLRAAFNELTSYTRSKDKARLTMDCLSLALDDAATIVDRNTMEKVARKHGLTRAAVCKRVAGIRRDFHLPANVHSKSAEAKRRYSETNGRPRRPG